MQATSAADRTPENDEKQFSLSISCYLVTSTKELKMTTLRFKANL